MPVGRSTVGDSVIVEPFGERDIAPFLRLALAEGWVCERWELDFLRHEFPAGCCVVREGERAVAFITAIRYGSSGWIGNLLVRREKRGRGLGTILMETVLSALVADGARTIWLTASDDGRPMYERLGFVAIDRIRRWRGRGGGGGGLMAGPVTIDDLFQRDRAGWGDTRESILRVVTERGETAVCDHGFLVLQPAPGGVQLGPWSCEDRGSSENLLSWARAMVGSDREMFLDVPAANAAAAQLLRNHGFAVCGETLLMYLGDPPDYRPESVYALASMGSMG
jgi:ribosomal protein S18 acetylase RimI-like enzyme